MRRITRTLSLLLALCLCIPLFAACGGREKTDLTGAKSLADLKGAHLAAQGDTFHEKALEQVEGITTVIYPSFSELLIALKNGVIDGYVAETPTALTVCKADSTLTYVPLENNKTGFTATDADVGVAVGLVKGSALREQINAVLSTITEEQKALLMQQAVAMAAGETVQELALSITEPENPVGVLRVAMECDYKPYNWTDFGAGLTYGSVPISGEGKQNMYANGYDVQIARYVAAKLNMKLEIYSMVWDSLIPALQSGTVDAIVAGMSPTAERKQEIDFTDTYYTSNLVIVIRKNNGENAQ